MMHNSSALRPRQPRSAPGQRQRSSIDRIMGSIENEQVSLHCNGLALPAHKQHEAAAQRSAGQRGGLGVKGVASLGGFGHVAAPANTTPSVKKKKKQSRVNQA